MMNLQNSWRGWQTWMRLLKMLTAAAPIAMDALKQRVRQHHSSRADKHLADSVRAGKPKSARRAATAWR
ncbi:hypothetical protein NIA69_11000 [Gemmiger formicilis]|nr:hypothetical protein [Gemmiger formicilis]